LIPYGIVGYDVLRKACKGVWRLQPFDENFLMALATVGAMVLGEYAEGVAVMLFYQIGELFQSCAVGKSRRSIRELMNIRPDVANLVEADGTVSVIEPGEIPVGATLLVRPGERIPLDGVVLEGRSALDTAALTGESALREIVPGDEVLSGCINQTGLLYLRTTKTFG
jgi:Cd2+/Zn2+-exporting ATPase